MHFYTLEKPNKMNKLNELPYKINYNFSPIIVNNIIDSDDDIVEINNLNDEMLHETFDNSENPINIPPVNTLISDQTYQCSDDYYLSGVTTDVPSNSLNDCKNLCINNDTCQGFNYDNIQNKCRLNYTIDSMSTISPNNTFCVKKNNIGQCNDSPEYKSKINNIYIDLNCYTKNLEKLYNHSDNMMVDLNLLTSNLKSCAFIKKNKSSAPETLLQQLDNNIKNISQQKTDIVNVPATVLLGPNNQVLGVDTFESNTSVSKPYGDNMMQIAAMIIITIILVCLIFR